MEEGLKLLDTNEAGEALYSVAIEMTGDVISVYVSADGTEHFPTDFQGEQARSLEDVPMFDWATGDEIDF